MDVAVKLYQTSSLVVPQPFPGVDKGIDCDAPRVLPAAKTVQALVGFTGTKVDAVQSSFSCLVIKFFGPKIVHVLVSSVEHKDLT